MAPRVTMLLCVLSLLPGVHAVARELDTAPARDEAIAAARASAEEWLALLDASDWAETYEQSGQMLKNLVSPDRWARRMSVTLGPLGKVESRAGRSSQYSTTMPGAPDGEYVVLEYDTSFENKQTALETVALRKESDGAWRVSGYFIK